MTDTSFSFWIPLFKKPFPFPSLFYVVLQLLLRLAFAFNIMCGIITKQKNKNDGPIKESIWDKKPIKTPDGSDAWEKIV